VGTRAEPQAGIPVTTGTRSPARIEVGSLFAALGAILLLVSLFLDWYGGGEGHGGITAWQTFEITDLILALLALGVLYSLVERLTPLRAGPILPGWAVTVAGPVALVLVVVAMINEPPILLYAPTSELETGIWLAFAGSVLICVGALLARVRISLVLAARDGQADDESVDRAAETRTMPAEAPDAPGDAPR
jgi:hypothetical protein